MKLLNLNDCGIRLSKGLSHRDSFGAMERLRLRLRKKENKEELNQWYKEVIDDLDSQIKSVEQTRK